MPIGAIITYRYVQLEPSLGGRTPVEHHGSTVIEPMTTSFFSQSSSESKKETIHPQTINASDQFWGENNQLFDEYSTHRPPLFGINSPEKIFCVNADPCHSRLPGKGVSWPILLSARNSSTTHKRFIHHKTLYSDLQGNLKHSEAVVSEDYATSTQLFSSNDSSPYSQFTRALHIFKPTSTKVDMVIVINDGIPYLSMDIMDQFEKMVERGKLPINTAFVFITCLPGLTKTVSILDSKASMPGMGKRTVDYELKIDVYADFLKNKLFPVLNAPTAPYFFQIN